jgi:hypothetical protein
VERLAGVVLALVHCITSNAPEREKHKNGSSSMFASRNTAPPMRELLNALFCTVCGMVNYPAGPSDESDDNDNDKNNITLAKSVLEHAVINGELPVLGPEGPGHNAKARAFCYFILRNDRDVQTLCRKLTTSGTFHPCIAPTATATIVPL